MSSKRPRKDAASSGASSSRKDAVATPPTPRIQVSVTPTKKIRMFCIRNLADVLRRKFGLGEAACFEMAVLLDMTCAQAAMSVSPVPQWFCKASPTFFFVRQAYVTNVQCMADAIVFRSREDLEASLASDMCASWLSSPGGSQNALWTTYAETRRTSIYTLHENWTSLTRKLHKSQYTCPVCKGGNVAPRDKQTRRGDEGSTIFYHCHDCERAFRIG